MTESELRVALVTAARDLYARGLLGGTSGNLSARVPGTTRLLLTPTGVPWPEVKADELALLSPDGVRVSGLAPSSESPLHLAIYAARPEIGAIVHTHSRFATVFSVLRRPIPAVHYLLAFAGRGVAVADYACYGTDALAASALEALGEHHAVLLANHGLVAVGATLHDACTVAAAVEEVAALAWHAACIGPAVTLSDPEMAEVAARLSTYGRRVE